MSNWIVECTKCGHSKPAEEAGILRVGAKSIGKITLGVCSACGGRLRMLSITEAPENPTTEE